MLTVGDSELEGLGGEQAKGTHRPGKGGPRDFGQEGTSRPEGP